MKPATQGSEQSFIDRFLGVLKLDAFTWQNIKRDPAAMGQAWIIVLLAGLISGIGSARQLAEATLQIQQGLQQASTQDPEIAAELQAIDFQQFNTAGSRIAIIIFSMIGAIIAWWLFAALSRWAARQFFGANPEAATSEEMRRLTGWAYAPALLNILAVIPVVGAVLSLVVAVWTIVTQVQSVKHGMNLSTGKAIGASIVAWILPGIIITLLICACLAIVAATGGVTPTTP